MCASCAVVCCWVSALQGNASEALFERRNVCTRQRQWFGLTCSTSSALTAPASLFGPHCCSLQSTAKVRQTVVLLSVHVLPYYTDNRKLRGEELKEPKGGTDGRSSSGQERKRMCLCKLRRKKLGRGTEETERDTHVPFGKKERGR